MDKRYDETAKLLEINGVVVVGVEEAGPGTDGLVFEGQILIDGEYAGEAVEAGTGGPMEFYGVEDDQDGKKLEARLEERAAGLIYHQTQPVLPLGADGLVARLVDRANGLETYRKLMSERLVWIDASGDVMEGKRTLPRETLDRLIEDKGFREQKLGARILLNAMDEKKGFDMFFRQAMLNEGLSVQAIRQELDKADLGSPSP